MNLICLAYSIVKLIVHVLGLICVDGLKITSITHPDEFGIVDEPFTLMCNKSTEDPVSWWYRSSPDAEDDFISFGGTLLNGYIERCSLEEDDLVIEKLQLNDTGIYICLEQAGQGVRHITHLFVSDDSLRTAVNTAIPNQASVAESSSSSGKKSKSDADDSNSWHIAPALAVVAVVLAFAGILFIAIVICEKNRKCSTQFMSHEDIAMPLVPAGVDVYKDGETFWTEQLPRKLECEIRAIVKVEEKCRDIFILTGNPTLFKKCSDPIVKYIRENYGTSVDAIVTPETKGFLFATHIASNLGLRFIPICKRARLYGEKITTTYKSRINETVVMEAQKSAFRKVRRVIFLDHELATGESTKAAIKMLKEIGVKIMESIVINELCEWNGRQNLNDTRLRVTSLVRTKSVDAIDAV